MFHTALLQTVDIDDQMDMTVRTVKELIEVLSHEIYTTPALQALAV